MFGSKIKSIKKVGIKKTYDLRVPGNDNFFLSNGILSHNSGKSQLNKFGLDVCNKMGLMATEITQFTTTGLIGTFDRSAHEYNVKNGLSEANRESTPATSRSTPKTYRSPVIYGDMYNYDILFIDEGKILFEQSQHTEQVLSVLQPALDYPGRVRKKLAAEQAIDYDCNCTLVTTTVEFGSLGVEILLQGFFPRCLFYQRKLSTHDYAMMHRQHHSHYFDVEEYNTTINNFVNALTTTKNPVSREPRRIVADQECLDSVKNMVMKWFRMAQENMYGTELQVLQAFISRLNIFAYKIAGQIAVVNNRMTNEPHEHDRKYVITHDEMGYAIDLVDGMFNRLIDTMHLSATNADRNSYSLVMAIMGTLNNMKKKEGSKTEIINIIMNRKKSGRIKAQKEYADLISSNLMHEKRGEGNTTIATPNWALWYEKNARTVPSER